MVLNRTQLTPRQDAPAIGGECRCNSPDMWLDRLAFGECSN